MASYIDRQVLKQFQEAVAPDEPKAPPAVKIIGTVYEVIPPNESSDGKAKYEVVLDGSPDGTPIPVSSTLGETVLKAEDRVLILMGDHGATIVGNLTKPADESIIGVIERAIEDINVDEIIDQYNMYLITATETKPSKDDQRWTKTQPSTIASGNYLWVMPIIITKVPNDPDAEEIIHKGEPQKSQIFNGIFTFMNDVTTGNGSTTINGGALYGGTIALGGDGNVNGQLTVKNASGTVTNKLNNEGLYSINGVIGGWNIGQSALYHGPRYMGDVLHGAGTYMGAMNDDGYGVFIYDGSKYMLSLSNGGITAENEVNHDKTDLDCDGLMVFDANYNTTIGKNYSSFDGDVYIQKYLNIGTAKGSNGGCVYVSDSYVTVTKPKGDSSWGNAYWHATSAGNYAIEGTKSSREFKDRIDDIIDDDLNPRKLYNLPVRQFVWKSRPEDGYDVGFIADEVDKFYPVACLYQQNDDGTETPRDWDMRIMIPAMMKLLQEQHEEIEILKGRINEQNN